MVRTGQTRKWSASGGPYRLNRVFLGKHCRTPLIQWGWVMLDQVQDLNRGSCSQSKCKGKGSFQSNPLFFLFYYKILALGLYFLSEKCRTITHQLKSAKLKLIYVHNRLTFDASSGSSGLILLASSALVQSLSGRTCARETNVFSVQV